MVRSGEHGVAESHSSLPQYHAWPCGYYSTYTDVLGNGDGHDLPDFRHSTRHAGACHGMLSLCWWIPCKRPWCWLCCQGSKKEMASASDDGSVVPPGKVLIHGVASDWRRKWLLRIQEGISHGMAPAAAWMCIGRTYLFPQTEINGL